MLIQLSELVLRGQVLRGQYTEFKLTAFFLISDCDTLKPACDPYRSFDRRVNGYSEVTPVPRTHLVSNSALFKFYRRLVVNVRVLSPPVIK